MNRYARIAALLFALALPGWAGATITCSVASSGVATAYSPGTAGNTVVQGSFTVTCSRDNNSGSSTINFSVLASNGQYPLGINNRAAFGNNRIRYDLYMDPACGTQWKGGNAISGSISLPAPGTASATRNYWACIGPGQNVAAGTYTDSVVMTMSYTGNQTATGTLGVSIATPASCALTAAPGNVVFNYLAFGPAQNASTTFGVTCTQYLPYTMALDATSGTALGLNYTLSLSAAGGTGTGGLQTHTISGTMAAGQAGSCASGACSASQARTLTITY